MSIVPETHGRGLRDVKRIDQTRHSALGLKAFHHITNT